MVLSLLGLQTTVALSQGYTPAAMDWQRQQRLWLQSNNAAGTALDDTRNYSDVSLGYDVESGNYHRPQLGEKEKNIRVGSEGFLNLRNAYVWGRFSFNQRNADDAGYNASIADPYRVMPYYVADTHLSDWRNQYYNLQFRAATPLLWKHIAFGLEGKYVATLAAKQRDPRVDTRFYTLELKPGVVWKINRGHAIGANFEYASIKEDSRMSNVNLYVDQDYYELYGLGMASKGIGSGRTTNYFGDRIGGSVQYQYAEEKTRVLFETGYSLRVENVEVSFSTPKKDASVREERFFADVKLLAGINNWTHSVNARYTLSDADGIQYTSQRDNTSTQSGWVALYHDIRSKYKQQLLTADYTVAEGSNDDYNWMFGAGMRYSRVEDKYLLPVSTKDAENLEGHVSVKRNQSLSTKLQRKLLISLSGGYSKNLSGRYSYGGVHTDYPTVTELETLEEAYLKSDYKHVGVSLTYSQQYKEGSKTHLFARLGFNYTKTSDFDYDHRSLSSVSIGMNF